MTEQRTIKTTPAATVYAHDLQGLLEAMRDEAEATANTAAQYERKAQAAEYLITRARYDAGATEARQHAAVLEQFAAWLSSMLAPQEERGDNGH